MPALTGDIWEGNWDLFNVKHVLPHGPLLLRTQTLLFKETLLTLPPATLGHILIYVVNCYSQRRNIWGAIPNMYFSYMSKFMN